MKTIFVCLGMMVSVLVGCAVEGEEETDGTQDDLKLTDIQGKLDRAKGRLPTGTDRPLGDQRQNTKGTAPPAPPRAAPPPVQRPAPAAPPPPRQAEPPPAAPPPAAPPRQAEPPQAEPPPQNEPPRLYSTNQACVYGNGLYCGGNGIDGDRSTLYRCTNGRVELVSRCGSGCHYAEPGLNDYCE